MAWLQENYIVAVVGLVVAIILLWWLFGRSKPDDLAPPAAEPAKPAKPLEPVKPEIIAAEPARFKPIEPKPQPQPIAPPAPTPVAEPVAMAPPPPKPAPIPEPIAQPAPPAPAPKAAAPKPAATPKPAAKPAVRKVAEKPPVAKPAKKVAAKPAPGEPATAPAAEPAILPPPAAAPAATPTAAAKADNLQLLKGVGPKMVGLLNGLGVTSFQQIAAWTDADVAAIDPQLGAFQGRIARDNIVDQAGYLARGDKAGFETKYGALGGEI